MTDTRLARWERAVESYLAAKAEMNRLEQQPPDIDPHLKQMARALELYVVALEKLLGTAPPHLAAFGFKLACAPQMIELTRLESTALPRLIDDFQRLTGVVLIDAKA